MLEHGRDHPVYISAGVELIDVPLKRPQPASMAALAAAHAGSESHCGHCMLLLLVCSGGGVAGWSVVR